MTTVVGVICLFILLLILAFSIYRRFDHSGWQKWGMPDYNAEIMKVIQCITFGRQVNPPVKDAWYIKTTVYFSDGFYFVSYRTMLTKTFGIFFRHWEASTDTKMITKIATYAHEKAVQKKLKK